MMNLTRDHIVSVPMRRMQSDLYLMMDNHPLWNEIVYDLWDTVEAGVGLTEHGSTGYTGYSWNNDNWIAKIK